MPDILSNSRVGFVKICYVQTVLSYVDRKARFENICKGRYFFSATENAWCIYIPTVCHNRRY